MYLTVCYNTVILTILMSLLATSNICDSFKLVLIDFSSTNGWYFPASLNTC